MLLRGVPSIGATHEPYVRSSCCFSSTTRTDIFDPLRRSCDAVNNVDIEIRIEPVSDEVAVRLNPSIRAVKRHSFGILMRTLKTQNAYINCRASLIWSNPIQDAGIGGRSKANERAFRA